MACDFQLFPKDLQHDVRFNGASQWSNFCKKLQGSLEILANAKTLSAPGFAAARAGKFFGFLAPAETILR